VLPSVNATWRYFLSKTLLQFSFFRITLEPMEVYFKKTVNFPAFFSRTFGKHSLALNEYGSFKWLLFFLINYLLLWRELAKRGGNSNH